jgi:hypothetical protein
MRTTLAVLDLFEDTIATFDVSKDKVVFTSARPYAVGDLHLTKREAINLLNEIIDLIKEDFDNG